MRYSKLSSEIASNSRKEKKRKAKAVLQRPQKMPKAVLAQTFRAKPNYFGDQESNTMDTFYLQFPGQDRNEQTGYEGVAQIVEPSNNIVYEAKLDNRNLGVFATPEEAARARDMCLIVDAYRKRKNGIILKIGNYYRAD